MTSEEFKKLKHKSSLEQTFLDYWKLLTKGYPAPVREYVFEPSRKYRFDFAWPIRRPNSQRYKLDVILGGVAVELEGGVWTRGRHVRGKGFIADCDKYNLATLLGWKVFRFSVDHFKKTPSQPIRMVMEALNY